MGCTVITEVERLGQDLVPRQGVRTLSYWHQGTMAGFRVTKGKVS